MKITQNSIPFMNINNSFCDDFRLQRLLSISRYSVLSAFNQSPFTLPTLRDKFCHREINAEFTTQVDLLRKNLTDQRSTGLRYLEFIIIILVVGKKYN